MFKCESENNQMHILHLNETFFIYNKKKLCSIFQFTQQKPQHYE